MGRPSKYHVFMISRQSGADLLPVQKMHEQLWPEIDAIIDSRADRLIRFRRRLHATPEASNQELATTALVADTLRENGLEPRILADQVGIVVDIDLGAPSNRFIALRSELDCVNVNDDKQVPYASTRPGLCHACGHDAHSTIVLGTALTIAKIRSQLLEMPFQHNVRMIFQPAEETATGARSVIKQGALDGVEAILALHVDPMLDAGRIGLRNGPLTSACKSFRVPIRGRSGHSARPYEAIDPIPAAINIVSMFYQLCPRSVDARHPLALTVASIASGAAENAIPDDAVISGTLRTTRVEDLDAVQRRMASVVKGVSESTGCEAELQFLNYCPPTNNDEMLIDLMAEVAASVVGADHVVWLELPSLGAEDFGFFQELIPGAIVRLGVGDPSRPRRPLHSSLFDIDESVLAIGAKFLTRTALQAAGRMPPRMD